MDAVKKFLMNPVFVLAVCASIEEGLPMVLDAMDMLQPQYRKPVGVIIALVGLGIRALKQIETMVLNKQVKDAALLVAQAEAKKKQEEMVP